MTSCRGILVAGVANRARTQMAEGFLRALTNGSVFIKSGGVHHAAQVHPLAISVMQCVDVDITGQSVSSLESARWQGGTYDVYISVDGSYTNRSADRYHRLPVSAQPEVEDKDGEGARTDSLLFPSTPAHWQVGFDAADARQRWDLWSPRDPTIAHERSTRKFQDDLYEGEPLFMRLQLNPMRKLAKVSERWEVEEVAVPYTLETEEEQRQRFCTARDVIAAHSARLLRRLEQLYGESFLINQSLAERLARQSTAFQHALTTSVLDSPPPFQHTSQ